MVTALVLRKRNALMYMKTDECWRASCIADDQTGRHHQPNEARDLTNNEAQPVARQPDGAGQPEFRATDME